MPYLKIETNADIPSVAQQAFVTQASAQIAELLGKPEAYVMVRLDVASEGVVMAFGGSTEPCAYCELKSLGLPEVKSTELSQAICTLLEKAFGIDAGRVYIEMSDHPRNLWGWNNKVFG